MPAGGMGELIGVSPYTFLRLQRTGRIIDVRSPGEFARGHIPGAVNVPLFDDEQRAEVGTLYKQRGRRVALTRGFELIGERMEDIRQALIRNSRGHAVRIHCWRGGMRSESVAWLAQRSGLNVYLLRGGYKAYRHHVLEGNAQPLPLRIVGGLTGAGKTDILQALEQLGEQVVDLEGLANHKGSAFGALGQEKQPSTEMFENLLFERLEQLDLARPIYMEDESRSIGRIFLPEQLHAHMAAAPTVVVDTPRTARVERLVRDYTCFPPEEIVAAIEKLSKRLGSQRVRQCCDMVRTGDMQAAVSDILTYYDKQYSYLIETKHPHAPWLEAEGLSVEDIAQKLTEQEWR